MDAIRQIFINNKKWVKAKLAGDKAYFEKLSRDQTPDFLYIGCSDSRVPANEIMGLEPGEVFVHRNIANLVIPTDSNINSVVQYALEYLNVKHIIVCGHYGCGGVMAALNPKDMGQLNNWLQTLRDVYRIHQKELDDIKDEHKKFDRLVELNVIEQCVNIIKLDHFQISWYKKGYPQLHAWVYDLHDGLLKNLEMNVGEYIAAFRKIYDLKPE